MKKFIRKKPSYILLLAGLMAAAAFTGAAQMNTFRSRAILPYVKNEILIKFKEGSTLKDKMSLIVSIKGEEYQELSFGTMTRVILQPETSLQEALHLCRQNIKVDYAQRNYIYKIQNIPDDPRYHAQWAFYNEGQSVTESTPHKNIRQWEGNDTEAEPAWDIITDCGSVTAAVIDTGINYNHEDLAVNMWDGSGAGYALHGYDFVDDDDDPMDLNGHGTHIAGIIGAAGNNGIGVSGLCWNVGIMAVRALDETGEGTTADLVQGIAFALDNGADVINISSGREVPFDRAYSDAIAMAGRMDVPVIVPAGNGDFEAQGLDNDSGGIDGDGTTRYYPCAFEHDNLVCVAALDRAYDIAEFSNYGSRSVDIGAPGTSIISTYAGTVTRYQDDLSSEWMLSGGWSDETIDLGFGTYPMLINPQEWDQGLYLDNCDGRAYKRFNLSSHDAAVLSFFAFVDTEWDRDFLNVNVKPSGGDPFPDGTNLDSMTGTTGDDAYIFSYSLTPYLSENCTIGFQLIADDKNTAGGAGIFQFVITALNLTNNEYLLQDGTSMAAAYATGIACMVRSFNPHYTWRDTVRALKYGGNREKSLLQTTRTGNAASAMGSLLYINQPTGLKASIKE